MMQYETPNSGSKSTGDSKNGQVSMVYKCLLAWMVFILWK